MQQVVIYIKLFDIKFKSLDCTQSHVHFIKFCQFSFAYRADMASCPTYFSKLLYSMAEQNSVSQKILQEMFKEYLPVPYQHTTMIGTSPYCNAKFN